LSLAHNTVTTGKDHNGSEGLAPRV
jgi:hypothetical protein